MIRRVLTVLACLAASTSGVALAQASIPASSVVMQIGNRSADGFDIDLISRTDQPKMFNKANCDCNTPRTLKVTIAGAASFNGQINVYYFLGANCTDTTSRNSSCAQFAVHKLSDYFTSSVLLDIYPQWVVSPTDPSCSPSGALSGANTVFLYIDWNGDQAFDEENDTIQTLELNYDVEPPDVVTDVTVGAGEEALNVAWSVPDDTDIESVQVLCARGSLPVFETGTYEVGYESAASVCPTGVTDGGLPLGDGGVEDAGSTGVQEDAGFPIFQMDASTGVEITDAGTAVEAGTVTGVSASGGLAEKDPAFVCSGILGKTSSSARISTLQNGVPYYVAVVAIDQAGNASPVTAMVSGTPTEVVDFWESYKREGGQATGCVVGAPAGLAWLALAAGLALIVLAGSRRRPGGDR